MAILLCGAVAIGIVVGWLTRSIVARIEKPTVKTLSAVVPVIAGGAVTRALGPEPELFALYAVGLVVGFGIFQGFAMWVARKTGDYDPVLRLYSPTDKNDLS